MTKKIENLFKRLNVATVYDIKSYSLEELYYILANHLNNIVNDINDTNIKIDDKFIEFSKDLNYLLGEGLEKEVIERISLLIDNGTLEELINTTIFEELYNKVVNVKRRLDESSRKNVLEFGIESGIFADVKKNTEILQNMINNYKDKDILYFPSGIYLIGEIELGFKKNITIEGESSSFASFMNKKTTESEFTDTLTKIVCCSEKGRPLFSHRSCVLITKNIGFYNYLELDNPIITSIGAYKQNLFIQTRGGLNSEKGKVFPTDCGFYGFKVVAGDEYTFPSKEVEYGFANRVEDVIKPDYYKQSCFVASRCRFTNNGIAINQPVDGRLIDCSFNKNDYGVVIRERGGFTSMIGCRFEWHNNNGVYIEKAHDVTVNNCEFDRNGNAGIYLFKSTNCNISNNILRRSGAKCVDEENSEIYRDDYSKNVHLHIAHNVGCNIQGNNTVQKNILDQGVAPTRPTNGVYLYKNTECIITNNIFTGCTKEDKTDANVSSLNVNCIINNNIPNVFKESV